MDELDATEFHLNKSVLKILMSLPHPRVGAQVGPEGGFQRLQGLSGGFQALGTDLFSSGSLCSRILPAESLFLPLSLREGGAPFILCHFFWTSSRWSVF